MNVNVMEVNVLKLSFKSALLALFMSLTGLAFAQETPTLDDEKTASSQETEINGDDWYYCYTPQWYYDDNIFENAEFEDIYSRGRGRYTWYCQAKPIGAPSFQDRYLQFYDDDRRTARELAVLRCERFAPRCVTRCALMPRVCRPHFWP